VTAPIEACHQAVGARVRMIRETLGLDQSELGKRVGLNRTSITNIEAGRQRLLLHNIETFARALGTSPKHLLKGVWW
jgi:transcriptional regulator with XRE-family HTH domain